MTRLLFLLPIIPTLFLCIGCDQKGGKVVTKANDVTSDQLVQIAKQHIKEQHPTWPDPKGLPPKVTDKGEYWEVTFELPSDTQGGVPIVGIDKETLKVLRARHTQ